jgi:serine/threonine protein kinase
MPIELGSGAMGVTYKALDVDLRRPVARKVISERYTNDEAARRRFLREARAAVSLRHALDRILGTRPSCCASAAQSAPAPAV